MKFFTAISIFATLVLSSCVSTTHQPAISEISTLADTENVKNQDIYWDAWNGNRNQNSGPVFYVNKDAGKACKVIVNYQVDGSLKKRIGKGGQLKDGLPPNLVMRVFNTEDRSILVKQLGQKNAGWYQVAVDLNNMPSGRYRFAFVGWFNQVNLKTIPVSPVGVIGGGALGLTANGVKYFYVPKDVSQFSVAVGSFAKGQRFAVYDDQNQLQGEMDIKKGHLGAFSELKLKVKRPGKVWKIVFSGDKRIRLKFDNIPGLLWDNNVSAENSKADSIELDERRLAYQWQVPLQNWLKQRKPEDFIVKTKGMKQVDFDKLPDSQIRKLSVFCSWVNMFATGRSLLKYNQIVDPESPYLGLFVDDPNKKIDFGLNPDGKNAFSQIGYALNLANLYASPVDGLNAYYLDPGLGKRALAAAFQLLLCIPEKQFMTMDFVHIKMLGHLAQLLVPHMKPELAEAFKAGILEFMCRNAYFDGYQSNQGLNVMVGLKTANNILKDPELERWYARYMDAFFRDQFKDWNHGQVPAGFYQESGGLDGAYNTYSTTLLMLLMHKTKDPMYRKSLDKNFEFLRHLAVTLPNGKFNSARQWNTRTDSNAYKWHNYRAGAALPGCATFLLEGNKTTETVIDLKQTRENLKKKSWNHLSPKKLESYKWWGGFGGMKYDFATEFAQPIPLACQEKGDFYRTFGDTYSILKKGPWYAVFYSGDYWTVGACGSGLATLWHQDFGPLILGDTEKESKSTIDTNEPDGKILILADGWNAEKRFNTKTCKGTISINPTSDTVSVTVSPRKGGFKLTRSYIVTDKTFISNAKNVKGKWQDHDLYLPLVSGPNLKLEAIDGQGNPIKLKKGVPLQIKGFRWTGIKCKNAKKRPKTPAEINFEMKNTGKTIELTFPKSYPSYLHCKENCGDNELTIIRVNIGKDSGKWKILR